MRAHPGKREIRIRPSRIPVGRRGGRVLLFGKGVNPKVSNGWQAPRLGEAEQLERFAKYGDEEAFRIDCYYAWLYPDLSKFFPGTSPPDMVFPKGDVEQPASTPVLVDANWCGLTPKEDDPPARDLYDGLTINTAGRIGRCTIARHGSINAGSAPRSFPQGRKMPGAINVGAADGHVAMVKLEDLWSLTWHRGWQTPAQRPP